MAVVAKRCKEHRWKSRFIPKVLEKTADKFPQPDWQENTKMSTEFLDAGGQEWVFQGSRIGRQQDREATGDRQLFQVTVDRKEKSAGTGTFEFWATDD